jgi:hypothetical protein
MLKRTARLCLGIMASATVAMSMVMGPVSQAASAAQATPGSAAAPSAALPAGLYYLFDKASSWAMDGRENCCGGEHVASPYSDGTTQEWVAERA